MLPATTQSESDMRSTGEDLGHFKTDSGRIFSVDL